MACLSVINFANGMLTPVGIVGMPLCTMNDPFMYLATTHQSMCGPWTLLLTVYVLQTLWAWVQFGIAATVLLAIKGVCQLQ